MWEEVASAALKLVLTIASALVSIVLIPYLKNVVVPWLQEKHIYDLCVKFVRAAEKMSDSNYISKEDKKKFVIEMLEARGVKVTATVDAFIESAVGNLDDFFASQYTDIVTALGVPDDLDGSVIGDNGEVDVEGGSAE